MTAQPICSVMVARPYTGGLPVGTIISYLGPPRDYLPEVDGRALRRDEYPELFSVLGTRYCPPEIRRKDWLSRMLRRLRIADRRMPNPAYDPDTFRLPDFRERYRR